MTHGTIGLNTRNRNTHRRKFVRIKTGCVILDPADKQSSLVLKDSSLLVCQPHQCPERGPQWGNRPFYCLWPHLQAYRSCMRRVLGAVPHVAGNPPQLGFLSLNESPSVRRWRGVSLGLDKKNTIQQQQPSNEVPGNARQRTADFNI